MCGVFSVFIFIFYTHCRSIDVWTFLAGNGSAGQRLALILYTSRKIITLPVSRKAPAATDAVTDGACILLLFYGAKNQTRKGFTRDPDVCWTAIIREGGDRNLSGEKNFSLENIWWAESMKVTVQFDAMYDHLGDVTANGFPKIVWKSMSPKKIWKYENNNFQLSKYYNINS